MKRALLAILFFSWPATAHWQKTRWGMTVDQSIKATASPNTPVSVQTPGGHRSYSIPYVAVGKDFTAKLIFAAPSLRLSAVILEPADRFSCMTLESDLGKVYGPPQQRKLSAGFSSVSWWDKASGNKIALYGKLNGPEFECAIEYSPLGSTAESGL